LTITNPESLAAYREKVVAALAIYDGSVASVSKAPSFSTARWPVTADKRRV